MKHILTLWRYKYKKLSWALGCFSQQGFDITKSVEIMLAPFLSLHWTRVKASCQLYNKYTFWTYRWKRETDIFSSAQFITHQLWSHRDLQEPLQSFTQQTGSQWFLYNFIFHGFPAKLLAGYIMNIILFFLVLYLSCWRSFVQCVWCSLMKVKERIQLFLGNKNLIRTTNQNDWDS